MGAQAQESVFCYFVFVFDHNSDLPKKSFAYYSSAPSTVIDMANYIELIDAASQRQYHPRTTTPCPPPLAQTTREDPMCQG